LSKWNLCRRSGSNDAFERKSWGKENRHGWNRDMVRRNLVMDKLNCWCEVWSLDIGLASLCSTTWWLPGHWFSEEVSGTLLTEGGRPGGCCPVGSFHSVVQTKSSGRAHATHLMSFVQHIDQIQTSAEICSGAVAYLAKTIDHESEAESTISLRVIRTVVPHYPGHRWLQEQNWCPNCGGLTKKPVVIGFGMRDWIVRRFARIGQAALARGSSWKLLQNPGGIRRLQTAERRPVEWRWQLVIKSNNTRKREREIRETNESLTKKNKQK
jgi:hypothetical protein